MNYQFVIADVFTDSPFGGNQLAVLTDALGISDEGMQLIAREFNFAETTFVLPPSDPSCARRVRIFTPRRELEFAGHPTVGTACALVKLGHCEAGLLRLEEGIGPIEVDVGLNAGSFRASLRLDQPPVIPKEQPNADQVAEALSVGKADVLQVFFAGMGVDFTFAKLKSPATVDSARLNQSSWERDLRDSFGPQLFLFSGELTHRSQLYARMFAPAFGIAEDPATGSAVAALVGAAAMMLEAGTGEFSISVDQGVAMGRPSRLEAIARFEDGQIQSIEVGGATAFVAGGEINVPPQFLSSDQFEG